MGVLYNRLKTWIDNEVVRFDDLNAEFDNILNNGVPLQFDDYSSSVAQMKLKTDPGEVGSEIQATTLAGELERLRFLISEITGNSEWYESPSASLDELNQSITTSGNKIVSGKSRSLSNQLVALDPDGTAATLVLRGASTPFVYKVDAIQFTISTDVSLTSLQTASGNGTTDIALVDDGDVADGDETKVLGENGTTITVDVMGTEILALIGKRATFRINNGATDEFFTAFVESSTELTKARRGYFFDDLDVPLSRIAIADDDTITLMKATWIFANTAGAIVASFLEPIYDVDQPTATAGQFWFDLANDTWKVGNGASFDAADATLIGECFQDDTGTIGARTHEIAVALSQLSTPSIEFVDVTQVRSKLDSATVSVFGSRIDVAYDFLKWDMDTDLDSGVSEGASTTYHLYMDEDGDTIISDVPPYDRRDDLLGFYHPHQTWRSIGSINNDGSSNFDAATLMRISDQVPDGTLTKANQSAMIITTDGSDPGIGGMSKSTSSGSFSTSSTSRTAFTNLDVTITTTGRPVMLTVESTSLTDSTLAISSASSSVVTGFVYTIRDSTDIAESQFICRATAFSGSLQLGYPVGSLHFIDTPGAGTFNYTMEVKVSSGGLFTGRELRLVAFEL